MRRCIKCPSPALTNHDLCLECIHGELAARRKRRKPRKPRSQTFTVSVSAAVYEAVRTEARKRRTSMRALIAEVCRD